jgi:hypothetical protein
MWLHPICLIKPSSQRNIKLFKLDQPTGTLISGLIYGKRSKDCVEEDLPDVSGYRAVQDFLTVLSKISSDWANHWKFNFEEHMLEDNPKLPTYSIAER